MTKTIADRSLSVRDLTGLAPGDTVVFTARSAASLEAARQTAYRVRRQMTDSGVRLEVRSDLVNQTITVTRPQETGA